MESAPQESLTARYLELIDEIVQATLKGKIRAKEQVMDMLLQGVSAGTGEMFERCLSDRLASTRQQVKTQTDELKLAKANRSLRALQTIEGEWLRGQVQQQIQSAIAALVTELLQSSADERIDAIVKILDLNRRYSINQEQLKQMAKLLQQRGSEDQEIQQLVGGINAGLAAWQSLETHLVSWIYDRNQGNLGFTSSPEQQGPWKAWAQKLQNESPRSLFQALALGQSATEWMASQPELTLAGWVELAVLLQYLQRGLVSWFDRMVYDSKLGAKLSIAGFLAFAVLWSQLATGVSQIPHLNVNNRDRWVKACFQVTLQILHRFSQQEYFPLYGGMFALFGGKYLRGTLSYLDQPLQQAEGTQGKARILTLLGYSLTAQGQYETAKTFHRHALEIAQAHRDSACEIANLNHLSRISVAQKDYAAAIDHSQRALILSRQNGIVVGEANALANLGYSEVLLAQASGEADPEMYERAIASLQRGLQLCEPLEDRQSLSLCQSSLGIAYVILQQPHAAINHLTAGWQAAQFSGDLYLQGLNLSYLAQADYQLQQWRSAVFYGCLGMYLLEQIDAREWRSTAALMSVLQGQIGAATVEGYLVSDRPKFLEQIGVDGYDYLPQLLKKYHESMD
jgi:tetratricopeptide (TPR) repeat protein